MHHELLKDAVFQKVAEYYNAVHGKEPDFAPGRSRIPYAQRVFNEKELIQLVDAAMEFWLTYGRFSEQFERELASFLDVKHCFLVNSGSSANLLAFMALTSDLLGERKIERGDEVITVAAAFPTTVAPIVQYGAIPVFVDIDLATYNIEVEHLEKALSERSKAVMIAHTLGNPFAVDSVCGFCKKNNLWLIEDNSDALGSQYDGRYTGTFGDLSTNSFYPAHHITLGEGGAVCTNDSLLARIVHSLRDWGRDCWCPPGRDNTCERRFLQQFGQLPLGFDHKYVYSHFGYNLKATDLQAAIGCSQLQKLEGFIRQRKANFSLLFDGLQALEDWFHLPKPTPKSSPCWLGFPLTVREGAGFSRDDIVRHLEDQQVQTRPLFAGNLLRQPCFDSLRKSGTGHRVVGDLSNTDRVMRDMFWIGVYPGLTGEMLAFVVDTLGSWIRRRGKSL